MCHFPSVIDGMMVPLHFPSGCPGFPSSFSHYTEAALFAKFVRKPAVEI